MEENLVKVYIEDPDNINMNKLRDDMYDFAVYSLFRRYYGDEGIPYKSVSVGEIYDSKYSDSCQIRFMKNGLIVKCKYIKEKGLFEFEFYELTHVNHCYRIENEESGYKYFSEFKDYIDEVKQENKDYYEEQLEKERIKEEKAKAKLEKKAKKKKMIKRTSKNNS